jgi:transcriptional regulator
MYLPKHFEPADPEAARGLIEAAPLATLVALTAGGLVANVVPLEFVAAEGRQGTLRGHVARANPIWKEALPEHDVLAIFHGPQAYVSPNGYPSKREHGKVVPTWNYQVVQARGRLTAIEDAAWLRALVERLTDHHESRSAVPWAVSDAPEDYVQAMLRGIVGIEIGIRSLTAKFKLSQNRSAADIAGVAALLDAQPAAAAQAVAAAMRGASGPQR